MKNADMLAVAFQEVQGITGGMVTKYRNHQGLTKREQVLKDFMAAMLSNPEMGYGDEDGAKRLAGDAMGYTDAYFKELEK